VFSSVSENQPRISPARQSRKVGNFELRILNFELLNSQSIVDKTSLPLYEFPMSPV